MTYDEFERTISLFESGHVGYKIRDDIYAGEDFVFDEDGDIVPFTQAMEETRGFVLTKSNCDISELDSKVLVVYFFKPYSNTHHGITGLNGWMLSI